MSDSIATSLPPQHARLKHPFREPLNIAIIGTGISGMAAAWLLSSRHNVTVYEQENRAGGHSNTAIVEHGGRQIPVDTGFIVYNEHNYPNLSALFAHLGVATRPSEMSFAVSRDQGALEYSGADLRGLFAQKRNLGRPRFWVMLRDILRFYREAPRHLALGRLEGMTLGDYLAAGGYSESFVNDHLLPMAAAIWSSPLAAMKEHCAAGVVRFFENHALLRLDHRPVWRTVAGGSREYVSRLTAPFRNRIQLGEAARKVTRRGHGAWVQGARGTLTYFDHVVIATHSDQALALLADPTPLERELLGSIRYQDNPAILHSDPALMPRRRRVWSSWNYIGEGEAARQSACVTYWMNRLQGLDSAPPLFVTLNPPRDPAKGTLHGTYLYRHPLLDAGATRAQKRLWHIQGVHNTWFCGAYFGAGFHEDGLQAGLAVAEQLGDVRRPWDLARESDLIALLPAYRDAAE